MDNLEQTMGTEGGLPASEPAPSNTGVTAEQKPTLKDIANSFRVGETKENSAVSLLDQEAPEQNMGQGDLNPEANFTDVPDPETLSESEIERLIADPNSPKWYRKQLERFQKYIGRLKSEVEELKTKTSNPLQMQSEQESVKQIDPEIELLSTMKDKLMKLSSVVASPEEVVGALEEIIPPSKINEIKNHIAWEFLELPDGRPNLDSIQVIIDRIAGSGEGGQKVNARDVLNAIEALKRGVVTPEMFLEFSSDAEYESYKKMEQLRKEMEQQYNEVKAAKEFQEKQTRVTLLQPVVDKVKEDVSTRINTLLTKYNLNESQQDPEPISKYKASMIERIGEFVNKYAEQNPYLADVFRSIDLLTNPRGFDVDKIRKEIESFTNSYNYKAAVNRGLSDLTRELERIIADESNRFKIFVRGYEYEFKNTSTAPNLQKGTPATTTYSKEELDKMNSSDRRRLIYQSVSEKLRQQLK